MASIDLSENEWGQVMAMIAERPWRDANPLLLKIGEQLRAQHTNLMQPAPRPGNGPDKEVHHE